MNRNHNATIFLVPAMARGSGELGQAALALLADLHASVQTSIQVLLRRDLPELDRHTQQQQRILLALQAMISAPPARTAAETCCAVRDSRLQESAAQVLSLGLVQAALLTRARKHLAVLSNLLAGRGCGYSPAGSPRTSEFGYGRVQQEGKTHCQD